MLGDLWARERMSGKFPSRSDKYLMASITQLPFPTIWRESLKEQHGHRTCSSSKMSTIRTYMRLNVVCPDCLVCLIILRARLAYSNPFYWYTCPQATLVWIENLSHLRDVNFSQAPRLVLCCLQWKRDVDYLPMAKPDAINHLKIRHGCVSTCLMLAVGSFHLERRTMVI